MPYEIHYADNKIQITCPYKGHPVELINSIWGIIVFSIFVIILFISFFSQMIIFFSTDFWESVLFSIFPLGIFLIFVIETLWQISGNEEVTINPDRISIKHKIFNIRITQNYNSEKVNGVYASRKQDENACLGYFMRSRSYGFFSYKYGKAAFNFGRNKLFGGPNTFRFGSGIKSEEVPELISIIHHHYPQYIYRQE